MPPRALLFRRLGVALGLRITQLLRMVE